jgi:hypothetical protein
MNLRTNEVSVQNPHNKSNLLKTRPYILSRKQKKDVTKEIHIEKRLSLKKPRKMSIEIPQLCLRRKYLTSEATSRI